MSRKDYELIANCLNSVCKTFNLTPNDPVMGELVKRLSEDLLENNPKFKEGIFFRKIFNLCD